MTMTAPKKRITGICRVCGRRIVLRAVGSDFLNAVYPRFHKDPSTKEACEGKLYEPDESTWRDEK